MKQSQLLIYGDGKDKSPTALMLDKNHIKGLYFNQTTSTKVGDITTGFFPIDHDSG